MSDKAWIKNDGTLPVAAWTLVDVRFRCGAEAFNQPAGLEGDPYSYWAQDWSLDGVGMDIVEWRLAEVAQPFDEIAWEDMRVGDVVEFVRYRRLPNGLDHSHWGYKVGKKYTVIRDHAGDVGPGLITGDDYYTASCDWGFVFNLVERK